MNGPSPAKFGLALLLCSAATLALQAAGEPGALHHSLPPIEGLRLLLSLPVLLFVPGYFVVLKWGQEDLKPGLSADKNRISSSEKVGPDPAWTLIFAFGATILAHVLHFNLLRLIGIPITGWSLALIALAESALGCWWMKRNPPNPWAALEPSAAKAFALPPLVVALFALWQGPHLVTDSSWYFHSQALHDGWEASVDPGALETSWGPGSDVEEGALYLPEGQSATIRLKNRAPQHQDVPIFVLVHGPIGARTELAQGINLLHGETIAQAAPMEWGPEPVERYWDAGSTASLGIVGVPPQGEAELQIRLLPPSSTTGIAQPFAIRVWSNLSSGEVLESTSNRGIHAMHPFQLLNVTENVRWAHEVSTDYVLAGRSLDGRSTLHQPPIWTYLYAPARLLGSKQLPSASLLLLTILLFVSWSLLAGTRAQGGQLSPGLGALVALGAVQHGRLMVNDGSMNFPDSLYALALTVAVVSLCSYRVRIFALWAVLAALLRYPGAAVVGMAAFCLLYQGRELRLAVIDAVMRFSLAIGLFCAAMLATGLLTGALDSWLYTLYFETIPEHFFNAGEEADPLWKRPLVFAGMWVGVGGGVALVAFPLRGRLAKVALGTALLYFPCLAFIHHYSHHYFLPLIALATGATVSSLSLIEDENRRQLATRAAVGLSLLLCFVAWRVPL